MEIREAIASDIPEIIKVLRASLGESKLQKTETVWNFKHTNNPFGKSLVLLATENNEIIGIRAFMKWKWQCGKKTYLAFRAVDTATHPDHQGKGIFKKLTLKAIEIAKMQGNHFIFNTPNSKSKPGYLKMGWKEVDKLKVQLALSNPFGWKSNLGNLKYGKIKNVEKSQLEQLVLNYNTTKRNTQKLFTPKTPDYLSWRYENNPLQQYEVFASTNFYLAAYVKEHKYFKELRIVEILYTDKKALNNIKKKINSWAKKFGVQVISGHAALKIHPFLNISGKFGPILTYKNLSLPVNQVEHQLKLENWDYTLGDLELF